MSRFQKILATITLLIVLLANPTTQFSIGLNDETKIIGGSTAPAGGYPFVVSLRSSANSHFCGGTILNTIHILTAAHCVLGRSASNTIAVAGTNTLNAGGVSHASSRFIVHANYNSNSLHDDIALVRLASALTYTNLIRQTGLNTANTGAVAAILVGWGRTTATGPSSNSLQHLNTNTITHAQCQAVWGSAVNTGHICSFGSAAQGACNGDSGGPLIETSTGSQLGIISSGVACADGVPDIHTRVSSYIAWISSAAAS